MVWHDKGVMQLIPRGLACASSYKPTEIREAAESSLLCPKAD